MKKKSIILALLVVTIVTCLCVFAADDPVTVEFAVSAADSSGYFNVTVKVYNANFSGLQAALAFNPAVAEIVSITTGETTTNFDQAREILLPANTISEIWKNVNNAEGTFRFGNYVSTSASSSVINENRLIVAGSEGLAIYRIRFKKLSSEDFTLTLSTTEPSLPNGLLMADGVDELLVVAKFTYPDKPTQEVKPGGGGGGGGGGSTTKPPVKPDPEPQPEVSDRDKRIENTVILQIDNYAVVIDGELRHVDEDKEVQPYIKNNRTMVPLRLIAEAFGNEVGWNPEMRSVTIKGEGNEILLSIGSNAVYVNGEMRYIDVEPEITASRTFVPIRFVAEVLGKNVNWDESKRAVIICPAEFPWAIENEIETVYLADALTIMSPLVRDFYEGGVNND